MITHVQITSRKAGAAREFRGVVPPRAIKQVVQGSKGRASEAWINHAATRENLKLTKKYEAYLKQD
ncbi:MAG: hypothetical protein COT74_05675 [Bdellovibrionales bacterium CG10_big_fil_rev_8_21_14_0_10_45_34]|nr:MAG: hypothetical protein COT74_05675 [Bdellovibrionales bacterium CG10_big_fil_rev_8_21_14_0_10_45_34]